MADSLIPRLFRPPKGSYFLFGPRGCGKSTWLRRLHPEAHWIDLLDEGRYQSYLTEPSLFSAELDALPNRSTVVVDGMQRLPNLLNVVHQKIESKRLRFALLGSSARKLRRSGVNLLAGRAVLRNLHPYLPEELGDAFRLTDILHTGALAIIHAAERGGVPGRGGGGSPARPSAGPWAAQGSGASSSISRPAERSRRRKSADTNTGKP